MRRALLVSALLAAACHRHTAPQAAPEDRSAERAAIAKADADVRAAEAEAATSTAQDDADSPTPSSARAQR